MATPATPSAKLVRVATSEIERLKRAKADLELRRAALLADLEELDHQLVGYFRRTELLGEVIAEDARSGKRGSTGVADKEPDLVNTVRAVRGRELRRVAGRLLWRSQGEDEIHYREWLTLVVAAGFAVGGKDPSASFLTNIRDSRYVARG
jgi:hypothetical protein